jgi:hypothetical protein
MSLELTVSERVRKTIQDPKFKDRLALVVDEAHLVSQSIFVPIIHASISYEQSQSIP